MSGHHDDDGSVDHALLLEVLHELRGIKDHLRQSRQREARIEEMLMSLVPEVQALIDAVAAQGVAITDATTEMVTLEGQVTELTALVAELQGNVGAPVDAEDLAAIVSATEVVVASVARLKAAMPVPVPPPVVEAAATS